MDDLISRKEAIKAIRCGHLSAATIYGRSDEGMMVLAESIRVINSLPSAQRKKGKWIQTNTPERSDNIVCDQCGCDSIAEFNYCPNCGSYNGVEE